MEVNYGSFLPRSVNNVIDPEMSSLTYIKVDDVANQAAQMGKGTLMAKMDVEEAYRIIPIHPDNRPPGHILGWSSVRGCCTAFWSS